MNPQEKRQAEVKLRSVAAQAESLADDLRNGKLWEGEFASRVVGISAEMAELKRLRASDR